MANWQLSKVGKRREKFAKGVKNRQVTPFPNPSFNKNGRQ
jgi:hypothetical protein